MTSTYRLAVAGFALALLSLPAMAQEKPVGNDIPPSFHSAEAGTVYEAPKPTFTITSSAWRWFRCGTVSNSTQ